MLSTGSSVAVAAECRPPQAAVQSATPAAAAIELNARQFSADPLMELSYDVLLGHDHASCMGPRPQPPLIELAHLCVSGHHEIGEIHYVAQVERGIGQRLRRKQIFDAQLGQLRPQGQQANDTNVVDVTDQEYGWQAGLADMAGRSNRIGQAGVRDDGRYAL